MEILIRGHKWNIILYSQEEFAEKFDDETAALAAPKLQTIFFNDEELGLDTIIHELTHAYFSHGCTNSAGLSSDQIEEVFAELFSMYGIELIKTARALRKLLLKAAKEL